VGRAARLAGITIAAVLAIVTAAYVVLPLVVRALVRGLELTINAFVWIAASLSAGANGWTILSTVGRAVGRALVSPEAFVVVGGLVVVGAAALYGLQRLLGSEERPSRPAKGSRFENTTS
jgi:hypothetical protein